MNNKTNLYNLFKIYFYLILILSCILLVSIFGLSALSQVLEPFVNIAKGLIVGGNIKQPHINYANVVLNLLLISIPMLIIIFYIYSPFSALLNYLLCFKNLPQKRIKWHLIFNRVYHWNLFRLGYVLSPIMKIAFFGFTLLMLFVLFFNLLLLIAGFSLTIASFLLSFALFFFVLSLVFSIILSLIRFINTSYGVNCILFTEKTNNEQLKLASKKIILSKFTNFLICLPIMSFISVVIYQLYYVFVKNNFITKENILFTISVIIIDIIMYLGLNYLKTYLYLEFLNRNYKGSTGKFVKTCLICHNRTI